MSEKKKKFIIIDGNALIHRSFHALPPLKIKSGEMINAVYGFTTVLLKAIREFKPEYVALTLDRKEKTFRHEQYKEYKATRVKAPDELYEQIPKVRQLAEALNIPIYDKAGFEADDLIGTLTKKINDQTEKIIVTGDLDALQLVNKETKVYTMKRGLTDSVLYDEKAVKDRYGLTPSQIVDYKALRGDPSDNIPGVRGIGEKTAIELLQTFKTLDGVYKNIKSKKIRARIADLLAEYKEDAFLSRDLATIDCQVEIDFNLEDSLFRDFNIEEAIQLFTKFEFKTLLPRLQAIMKDNKTNDKLEINGEVIDKFKRNLDKFNYHLINDEKKFKEFLSKLKEQAEFVFDIETSGFDPLTADLLGISFSWEKGAAYYLELKIKNPFNSAGGQASLKESLFDYKSKNLGEDWLSRLTPIFTNKQIKKYGHNIKFDLKVLKNFNIETYGVAGDTMIASYLLNSGSRQHGLDAVALSELGFQKISKEDLLGKGKDKINFSEVPTEKLFNYSCEDADITYRLVKKLLPEIKKQKMDKLFNDMEIPLVGVLADMELCGIKINDNYLKKIGETTNKRINQLEKKIHELAGSKFNINSTQQLRIVLFENLELPTMGISKTKTGFSTGADELEKLKEYHPIIKLIQEYRELRKLQTTYIDALPKLINKKTNRIHTSYNQSVTATGRLSSTEPNLQNIPIRTELGREIRKSFVADRGYNLVSFDYSQIELRMAAHMSGDKKMIDAFKKKADIHALTAAEINRVKEAEVTSVMRQEAKAVNFGILYGQGPHGLSQSADISYARAKEFIDQYFVVYKDVKKMIDDLINIAREKGYAETMFNRRRYLPEMNSSMMQVKKAAERMAMNMPLQGTSADMIKIAMIKIHELLKNKNNQDKVRMLLQVHDELLFEIKDGYENKIMPLIRRIMIEAIKLKVPVEVDVKIGKNWGEMKTINN